MSSWLVHSTQDIVSVVFLGETLMHSTSLHSGL